MGTFLNCYNRDRQQLCGLMWLCTWVYPNALTLAYLVGVPGNPELKARATSVALQIGWKPPLDTGGADIESYILQVGAVPVC